jgi:hypothetical protein
LPCFCLLSGKESFEIFRGQRDYAENFRLNTERGKRLPETAVYGSWVVFYRDVRCLGHNGVYQVFNAFSSGTVMGFTVVGLGLLDLSIWFFLLKYVFYTPDSKAIIELVANRLTVEAAQIQRISLAMLTFGMGADLYESYVGSIVATIALAVSAHYDFRGAVIPMLMATIGTVASVIGSFFVRCGDKASQETLLGALSSVYPL